MCVFALSISVVSSFALQTWPIYSFLPKLLILVAVFQALLSHAYLSRLVVATPLYLDSSEVSLAL